MIIKKWNPTGGPSSTGAWEAIYPKVTTAEIYTSDGSTNIFAANKIKIAYLPDAVFDSLQFYGTIDASGSGFATSIEDALQSASSQNRSIKGFYWVVSTAGEIDEETTPIQGQGGEYVKYDFDNDDDGNVNANSTSTGALNVGDWIVCTKDNAPDNDGSTSAQAYHLTFGVVNNSYENYTGATTVSAGVPGLVPGALSGDRLKFFRGDGTWQTPADTNTFRTVTVGGTSIGDSNALDISAGTNVSFSGSVSNGDITINAAHPDITAASSLTASSRTYVTSITLDSNGHITDIGTGQETVTDTNTTYTAGSGIGLTGTEFSVDDGVGITAITDGVKMTYPIAIDNSGTGPDASSGFRIAPSSTGGALWFDLS